MKGVPTATRIAGSAALVFGLLFVTGLTAFARHIPTQTREPVGQADGIVALTGAASRIEDALRLLAAGHGERLLITGVHPATTRNMLSDQLSGYRDQFACCVDIGRLALNTVGNASETAQWAHSRGFRSLIVVTSNYHMPRSLAEFAHAMPDIELIPYPVIPERFRTDDWWRDPDSLRIVSFEFVKYVAALARQTMIDAPLAHAAARWHRRNGA